MQTKAKQIKKLITGFIEIPATTVLNGASWKVINTEVIATLATAGFMGGAIGNIASTAENLPGLISSGSNNFVVITYGLARNKLTYLGKEIYGRLTYPGSSWRVTYYYLSDLGIETAYTLTNNYSFNFSIPYRYELKDLPTDFAIKLKSDKLTDSSSSSTGAVLYTQELTVLSTNVLSNLDFLPFVTNNVSLIVNGETLNHIGTGKQFTVAGLAVTWLPLIAGYNIVPTDRVIVQYYLGAGSSVVEDDCISIPILSVNTDRVLVGVPAGYMAEMIVFAEIGGANVDISLGTTMGGSEISGSEINILSNTSMISTPTYVNDNIMSAFDIYISSAAWTTASLNVYAILRKVK